jgi:hypothetical protein
MDKRIKFIDKANKRHNFTYNYEKVEYINSQTKVCIICPEHGEFWQEPAAHVRGNRCPQCANLKRGDKKRWDKAKFIREASKVHSIKYDYSNVNYINAMEKVSIICPEHGEFWQTPSLHLSGQGCPKCAGKNLSKDEIIEKFNDKHDYKYDYSKVEYRGSHQKVCIICPEHGDFWQTPAKHLLGQGCKECSKMEKGLKKRITTSDFLKKVKNIHGDKYDYSNVRYITSHNKIEIICPKHGLFHQYPYDHLQGHGCPSCGTIYSTGEMEIYTMLCNILGENNVELHNRTILSSKEIDIFIPSLNIGIEYNGLLWHSELYNKDKWYHYNKMIEANKKNVKLIQIFEDEFINNKELVFSKLKHILNITNNYPKIMGRKTIIKEIGKQETEIFLNKNHIQGYTNSTIRLGAYYDNILVGVMCFNKTGNDNEWILNRFATDNNFICQGVGGKLFKYFIKNYNPYKIKSFADRRWTINTDNIYDKLGFKLTEILNPDYRYINKITPKERIHKFNLRKKTLHNKYNLPIDYTERQMVEELGYVKIWDCGLYKYEWNRE